MSDEFQTSTFTNAGCVTVTESMPNKEKAQKIAASAVIAQWEVDGFPYAVVEMPVLVDTIEAWLNQAEPSKVPKCKGGSYVCGNPWCNDCYNAGQPTHGNYSP